MGRTDVAFLCPVTVGLPEPIDSNPADPRFQAHCWRILPSLPGANWRSRQWHVEFVSIWAQVIDCLLRRIDVGRESHAGSFHSNEGRRDVMVRIPGKATTRSGAWRPPIPGHGDQCGAGRV